MSSLAGRSVDVQPVPIQDTWCADDFAVLDVETNGFSRDGHDMVELAIVYVDPPRVVFETLLKPRKRIGNRQIHGITNRDIRKAPLFADVAGTVADLLAGRVLVAHNASFDLAFLSRALGASVPSLCTMELHATLTGKRRDLETACAELALLFERGRHRAAEDALATALVLQEQLKRLEARGIRSLEQLAALRETHGRALEPRLTADQALAVPGREPPRPRDADRSST